GGDLLAEFVLGGVVGAQFDEVAARRDAGLLEVTRARLVHLARVDLPEPELHGGVAVLLRAADLGDDARPGLDDGHRNDPALIVEDLGHAELLAQDALPLRTHLSVRPLELDLDVDAGRKVEPHERVDRLGRRIDDVDQPLVRAHLEVLAAVLVLVRRADDAVHVLLGRQRHRARDLGARPRHRLNDLLRGGVDDLVVVGLEPDADLLSRHGGLGVLCCDESSSLGVHRPRGPRTGPEGVHSVPLFFFLWSWCGGPAWDVPSGRAAAITWVSYLMILVTRPEPTVRPPSRMANFRPSSMATGWISSTRISVLSLGMTISVPSGRCTTPVTSVVRK